MSPALKCGDARDCVKCHAYKDGTCSLTCCDCGGEASRHWGPLQYCRKCDCFYHAEDGCECECREAGT